ncbi:hypothetical protein [Rubellimicrobium mesophilum]|nr:hypothetical protein [Rubellimicrobium mesophilum]
MLWSGPALTFATDAGASLSGCRILDQIAVRMGVMSVHLRPAAPRPTLVVVPDAASRVRFATWLAAQPDVDVAHVGWLVLNGAARDVDFVVAAIRQVAELSSSAELVFVLPDSEWPGAAVVESTCARLVSGAEPDTPVVVFRPGAGGYEVVESEPSPAGSTATALLTISDSLDPADGPRAVDPQSDAEKGNATSVTENQLDPWSELETGLRPWRS